MKATMVWRCHACGDLVKDYLLVVVYTRCNFRMRNHLMGGCVIGGDHKSLGYKDWWGIMHFHIVKYSRSNLFAMMRLRAYSVNDPTSGIRACVETLNKKNSIEAIKSRFGGNVESKKMQKNVLKHQFENFSTASNENLDKAYDRFQKLISQLEVHGAPISKEDINQKFLRSLPPSWNQIALIMRNKPDIDEIDIDDLYNNLRVYEDELKRSSSSNSASQNLAFLSSENTSSTNEVSTASGDFGVSTAGGINQVPSTPCAHDVAYSFFAQPTTSPQLENEDFQQMDGDDLEELDLRWQVAMLTIRVKKFIQRTGRNLDFKEKRSVMKSRRSSLWSVTWQVAMHPEQMILHHRNWCVKDGLGGYDWACDDFEVEPVNYALMAISSSSSSSLLTE
ncbi:hypothetical protein Tco_0531637 [Tanacetum coccineum]